MRKRILFVLICSLAAVFILTCNQKIYAASAGPNTVSIPTQPAQSVQQQAQTANTPDNNQIEIAKEQLRGDFYRYLLIIFGTALGILVTIIILLIGHARWSNKREYDKAVDEAKEALKDVMDARKELLSYCEQARENVQQAQEKLTSINTSITEKFDDIEGKAKKLLEDIKTEGKKQINESIKEGEHQRKVNELLNQALKLDEKKDYKAAANCYKQLVEDFKEETYSVFNNWGTVLSKIAKQEKGKQIDELFTKACEKYEKALIIKNDYQDAFFNWGIALVNWAEKKDGEQAKKLFTQAFEKLQKARELKPDDYETLNSLGGTLLYLRRYKEGQEHEKILNQIEEVVNEAESIKTGSGSYNFACLYGIREDKENCRKWLETAEKAGKLPPREHTMKDEDLKIVRDEEWFKKLRFKGE